MPSAAASRGWIITEALPSRACEDGVSLNEVLRKERDGLVASDPEAFFLPIDRFNERYDELQRRPERASSARIF